MGKSAGLILMLLFLVVAAAACGTPDTTPTPGTPAAIAPTSPSQPAAIPSVTPIAPSSGVVVYGSVESDAAGAQAAEGAASGGVPLFYSAQASTGVATLANATPVPLVGTMAPTPTISSMPEGTVTIPPIQDDGPLFNFINTLCIPLINFVLNATIGVAMWLWNTVGAQGGLLWQSLLCIFPPLGIGWYFLFFRRRRRRRGG